MSCLRSETRLLCLLSLVTSACAPPDAGSAVQPAHGNGVEEAFPGRTGAVRAVAETRFEGEARLVTYTVIDGIAVAGGDIVLGPYDEVARRSAGRTLDSSRWPACTMPFEIDPSLTEEAEDDARDAMAHWSAQAGVRFVEDATAKDRVVFVDSTGCSSQVGRTGGAQTISLAATCGFGSAVHEIGHALGLWHEQSRADRDQHVIVVWDNIEQGKDNNFETYLQGGDDGADLGDYDLASIMHYSSNAFVDVGLTCEPDDTSGCTLTELDGAYIVGQRNGLSAGDLAGVAEIYEDGCLTTRVDPNGAVVELEPFGMASGTLPVWLTWNGHAVPLPTTRFADNAVQRIDVGPYHSSGRPGVLSVWPGSDADWYLRDVRVLNPAGEPLHPLVTPPGPLDVNGWSHGGGSGGDEAFVTFAPQSGPALTLSLDLRNVPSSRDVWVMIDGRPVHILPTAWDPAGQHLDLVVDGLAEGAGGHRITVAARRAFRGSVANVVVDDGLESVDYGSVAGEVGWVAFGDAPGQPGVPFATFADPAVDVPAEISFTPQGFGRRQSGVLVVDGGWVPVPDQRWTDGDRVTLDVTGLVRSGSGALATWWSSGDTTFRVGDLELAVGGDAWAMDPGPPLAGDGVDGVLVSPPADGGLPGRTWTCPGCGGGMRVLTERVGLAPWGSKRVEMAWPEDAHTCVPLAGWERVVEHPDNKCDFHVQVDETERSAAFDVWVRNCHATEPGDVARARVSLWCFSGEEGFGTRGLVDTWSQTPTPNAIVMTRPAGRATQVVSGCSLATLEGNGDVDTGGSCRTEPGTGPGTMRLSATEGCAKDHKEYAEGWGYILGLPGDVALERVPFDARSGSAVVVHHDTAGAPGPDHLAFVMPTRVDTNCKDHGSFTSSCVERAGRVSCTLESSGSITGYTGEVWFLDGAFPDAVARP